jgi:beta-galactosidase
MTKLHCLFLVVGLFAGNIMVHADANALPLAGGLPPPADPSSKKPWTDKLELANGVLLRAGTPFYPIGFVFGTSDDMLAQAKAMGCNAVAFDIGWSYVKAPGDVPEATFATAQATIQRASDWGMASFPLINGHYVPGWFNKEYPRLPKKTVVTDGKTNQPLGSDGKATGSWFPYSSEFPALREEIVPFWKGAAKMLSKEPSVIGACIWNEPTLGGAWNGPKQFGDYSMWAIEAYRKAMQAKYTELSALNAAQGTQVKSWDEIEPPKTPEEGSRRAWLDWMEFGQHSFADFFVRERSILKAAAPDLLLSDKKQTNPWDGSAASSGANWWLMGQAEDIFGLDLYSGSATGSRNTLDAACSYADGKPVMIFETNSMPASAQARTPDMLRTLLWAPVVGGARGMFIFAMIKNTEHGILGDKAANDAGRAEYTRIISQMASHQQELASPRVPGRIGVVYSTTGALQMPGDTIPHFVAGAFNLLRNSDYPVDYIPEERCNAAFLGRYALVVLPSACILKKDEADALETYLTKGGKVLAFGNSLARDEVFAPQALPACLGLDKREPTIGDRSNQSISNVDTVLEPYLDGDLEVKGAEMVSSLTGDASAILPGQEASTVTQGKILANSADGYPVVVQTHGGSVVYCAFDSEYSNTLRTFVEGITREIFGLKAEARLIDSGTQATEPGVITGLRQDWKDPNKRYLIAINLLFRPVSVQFDLPDGWKPTKESLHDADSDSSKLSGLEANLGARQVYLFELTK